MRSVNTAPSGFQMGQLGPREGQPLAQGHTGGQFPWILSDSKNNDQKKP